MISDSELDALQIEALEELESEFILPERLPGDLDTRQIKERMGVAFSTARNRMIALVKEGKWTTHSVLNKDTGKPITVYRKVED